MQAPPTERYSYESNAPTVRSTAIWRSSTRTPRCAWCAGAHDTRKCKTPEDLPWYGWAVYNKSCRTTWMKMCDDQRNEFEAFPCPRAGAGKAGTSVPHTSATPASPQREADTQW